MARTIKKRTRRRKQTYRAIKTRAMSILKDKAERVKDVFKRYDIHYISPQELKQLPKAEQKKYFKRVISAGTGKNVSRYDVWRAQIFKKNYITALEQMGIDEDTIERVREALNTTIDIQQLSSLLPEMVFNYKIISEHFADSDEGQDLTRDIESVLDDYEAQKEGFFSS